jgi:hypothetical protein
MAEGNLYPKTKTDTFTNHQLENCWLNEEIRVTMKKTRTIESSIALVNDSIDLRTKTDSILRGGNVLAFRALDRCLDMAKISLDPLSLWLLNKSQWLKTMRMLKLRWTFCESSAWELLSQWKAWIFCSILCTRADMTIWLSNFQRMLSDMFLDFLYSTWPWTWIEWGSSHRSFQFADNNIWDQDKRSRIR